jgi:hypothetical protein
MGTHVLEEEVVAAEDLGGDNDIGIHRPVGEPEFAGEGLAPALRLAAGVLVADENGSLDLFQELLERVVRVAAKDESYPPPPCVGLHIAQPLLHEVVVAEVGIRVVGDNGKEDNCRQAEEVGGVDSYVEGGVVMDAHCALHPVDDALAAGARQAVASDENARVGG